jgi:hypothetical protein
LLTAIAVSQENLVFVDLNGLNERVTTSSATAAQHSGSFREKIVQRDGSCIITGEKVELCDAAHLIPGGKGDEVMSSIIWIF